VNPTRPRRWDGVPLSVETMPRLPGTDLDVSELCLGGNVFGWTADEPTSFALLDRYVDATPSTVRPFVDTAESYGDGESERFLGAWMASRGMRNRVVVATKAGFADAQAQTVLAATEEAPLVKLVLIADASSLAPNKSSAWTNHSVSPTHYVQPLDQISNVRVSARKIGKRHFSPTGPVRFQQTSARHTRVLITERIIIGKNCWTVIASALMCGNYIAERWAFVKHIVPREWKVAWRC